MQRMSGSDKALLALGALGLGVMAMRGNAEAATVPGGGSSGTLSGPPIVPEANLPQSAIAWYDNALTSLGLAGTFSERLVGFQQSRMQGVLGTPDVSHLTPATQQAIQSAVGVTTTGDLGGSSGGARRMRY